MSRIYVDRIYRIYVLHYVIYVIYGGIYDNLYFTKNIYVHIYVYIYGTCMTYIDIHVPNMSLICVIYVCSVWEVWFGAWSHIRRKRLNNTTFSIKIIQQNCFCNAVSVNRESVKLHSCDAESFGDQRKQSASYWKLTKRNSAKLALAKRPSVKLHSVKRYFSENVAVSAKWHSTGQRRCICAYAWTSIIWCIMLRTSFWES